MVQEERGGATEKRWKWMEAKLQYIVIRRKKPREDSGMGVWKIQDRRSYCRNQMVQDAKIRWRRREGEKKKDKMGDRRRTGEKRKKGRKGQSLDETERLENERRGINDNKRVISVKLASSS